MGSDAALTSGLVGGTVAVAVDELVAMTPVGRFAGVIAAVSGGAVAFALENFLAEGQSAPMDGIPTVDQGVAMKKQTEPGIISAANASSLAGRVEALEGAVQRVVETLDGHGLAPAAGERLNALEEDAQFTQAIATGALATGMVLAANDLHPTCCGGTVNSAAQAPSLEDAAVTAAPPAVIIDSDPLFPASGAMQVHSIMPPDCGTGLGSMTSAIDSLLHHRPPIVIEY